MSGSFPDFAAFWARYPRKVEKLAAEKAYAKARKIASAAEIMAGLLVYPFRADKEWQPHAATWLGKGGWIVEEDTPPPTVLIERDGRRHEAAELAESLGLDLLTPIDEQFPARQNDVGFPRLATGDTLADEAGAARVGRQDGGDQATDWSVCGDLFGGLAGGGVHRR